MIRTLLNRPATSLLAGVLAFGLAGSAAAQVPTAAALRAAKAATPTPLIKTTSSAHLDAELQRLGVQAGGLARKGALTPAALRAANPELRFGQGRAGATVLVRITAKDVNALLPKLRAQGFEVSSSYPQLHFVEGMLPVNTLLTGDVEGLASQGLLGVLASFQPESNGGAVTSQADYELQAGRARAYQPKKVTGSGINIGVLSDSFNSLNGAAAGVASGDLPVVNVLSDDGTTDEGRGMCELIYDLSPGSGLAFSTANGGEGVFAQHIRDLANTAKGNCKVIVDDVRYFAEPMFQDGVIAQAVTDVVTNSGVTYFSSAGNYYDRSYENASPQFVANAAGVKYLNFDVSGATTDVTQRVTIANGGTFRPMLQWSDPFYTTSGVKTDLNMFLVSVKNGVTADTVYRSNSRNINTQTPYEFVSYTNATATSGTTTFDLVIVLKAGATPTRLKYVNYGNSVPGEWLTSSSTATGHAAAAEAFAVAAVPYYNQRVPEAYTSKGGAMTYLFSPTGVALPAGTTRQKPNLASIDGTNTTFFGSDYEGDGFPNFFGTSAAAPHAAAVAALLRSSEPSLTPTQVYSRLVGSARLIGATTTDPLTGPGLVDAFVALYGPVVAGAAPLTEDLEKNALPTSWLVNSMAAGRVLVSDQAPASGSKSLILDAYPYITSRYSLNEVTLFLQNPSATNLTLKFRHRKFVAETDEQMPDTFTGTSNTDGVAISVDGGANWYRIFDPTGTNSTASFQTQTIDLTQFAATTNLTLGADVRLRFQQYGRGGSTHATATSRAGRAFDDIVLSTVASPAPIPLYSYGPQPTAGCAGLQVQYTDTSLYRPTSWAWSFPGGTPATSTDRNPQVTYNTPGHYAVTLSVTNALGTVARTDTGIVFIQGRAATVTAAASTGSICKGSTVNFTSSAVSCGTATYAWSFPGGSPASATTANATVIYANAGNYTATLVVTNAYGSVTRTFIVDVNGRPIPYAETFDAATTLPRGWVTSNSSSTSTYAWVLVSNIINRSGSASNTIRAPFARDANVGEYPMITSPVINLAGLSSPKLRFDLSYAPYATVAGATPTDIDSLIVRVLDGCTGAVLGNVYKKGATTGLATHTSQPNDYFPASAADWRQELVDLTPYTNKSVYIQFRGYNAYGNHLYIDNVNVDNVLSLTTAANTVGLEAWPNPSPSGTALNLRLPAFNGQVSLRLVDNLGRVVWQQQLVQTGPALERTLTLPVATGLYNLLYTPAGGTPAARRIVIE